LIGQHGNGKRDAQSPHDNDRGNEQGDFDGVIIIGVLQQGDEIVQANIVLPQAQEGHTIERETKRLYDGIIEENGQNDERGKQQ
jgi:hypothetical protein